MDYIHDLRKIIGPRKIILNCAGALIIRDNKILFQRRTDNGKWGLIGGLLEMNETYEEAALREIREETGLEVRLDSFLGIFHNHNMVWSFGKDELPEIFAEDHIAALEAYFKGIRYPVMQENIFRQK